MQPGVTPVSPPVCIVLVGASCPITLFPRICSDACCMYESARAAGPSPGTIVPAASKTVMALETTESSIMSMTGVWLLEGVDRGLLTCKMTGNVNVDVEDERV